jgi:hypothetical protein
LPYEDLAPSSQAAAMLHAGNNDASTGVIKAIIPSLA